MVLEQRKQIILKMFESKQPISIKDICNEFKISEVSARKLLSKLEYDGVIKRTWGGAVLSSNTLAEFSHKEKETRNIDEKKAIAKAAYKEINDGESIFMDSGTTTMELAKLIATGNKRNIFVATNAINIANLLAEYNIKVFVVGGMLRNGILCTTGMIAGLTVKRFNFDKAFMTGNHFTIEGGFTTPTMEEADFKLTASRSSKNVYALLDSSKYGINSMCQIAPITQANVVITDDNLPKLVDKQFEKLGIRLIRAK